MPSQPIEDEVVQTLCIRYIHFRDSLKRLRASIAYYKKDNIIYYDTVVVSPSEPLGDVSRDEARIKASSRAFNSYYSLKASKGVPWKVYRTGKNLKIDTHGEHSPFRYIKKCGFMKLGRMSEEAFRNAAQFLRDTIIIMK